MRTLDTTLAEFLYDLDLMENVAVVYIDESNSAKAEGICVLKGSRSKIQSELDEIENSIYKDAQVIGIGTGSRCRYVDNSDQSFNKYLVIYITLEPTKYSKFRRVFYNKLKESDNALNLDFPEVSDEIN